MNKCTELSDFEINKKVAAALGLNFNDGVIVKNGEWFYFDPCNNPADAMPIIIESGIGILKDPLNGKWFAVLYFNSWLNEVPNFNSNPLRAAMEVYLLMKDAENEG